MNGDDTAIGQLNELQKFSWSRRYGKGWKMKIENIEIETR